MPVDRPGETRKMNRNNYLHTAWNTPFIEQRADPYITHVGNAWYFTASIPSYDAIVLRRADSLTGLPQAEEKVLWRSHASGPMSMHIWAPEIHRWGDKWMIYFAAGEKEDIWRIRPYALMCTGDDPMRDEWVECGMLTRHRDDPFSFTEFSLDMTVFSHGGKTYCVWAEKVSVGRKISNLYIAEMTGPTTLGTPQMLLSSPTYAWERHEFWVNEGPAFLREGNRVYLTYSASDTSPAYCMGLLWADADADLMDISCWHKLNHPVLQTDAAKGLYGPGHNSFFRGENGLVYTAYHARQYDEIIGDPLYDPNRHCYIMRVDFENGLPVFRYENQQFQP